MHDISREGNRTGKRIHSDHASSKPAAADLAAKDVVDLVSSPERIVCRDHAFMFHPTMRTHRTQLVLPADLALPDWTSIGQQIVTISDSSGWWLGDWLIYGQESYPDRYRRAMEQTGLDYQTLRNYAWVTRRFIPSRRRMALSFQHHMEVAALPESDQDHWLDFAEKMEWSRNELRKQCRASSERPNRPEEAPEAKIQIQADQSRMTRWQNAAEREKSSLAVWITSVLDKAAVS